MKKLLSTGEIARRSARRPWLVILAWVLALVVAGVAATQLRTTVEGEFTNGAESVQAANLIEERLRGELQVVETVIVRSPTGTVNSAEFRAHVEEVRAELLGLNELVTGVVTHYDLAEAGVPGVDSMVAANERGLLLQVSMGTDVLDAMDHAALYLETIEGLNSESFEVLSVGDVSASHEFLTIGAEDLAMAQNYGLPAALVVLIIVFGALVAAGVPVAVGLGAVAVAVGLAAGVSQFFELDFFVTNMIAMIGLAVGIDYSLFIVERYREERRNGFEKPDAIAIAGETASKAVVFSGLTTTLALIGLFLLPMTTFQSLAIGAMLAVGVSVFAALTLIPAMLSVLGDRINWPRRSLGQSTNGTPASSRTGVWASITRLVMRRPAISMLIAVAILVAASLPILDLNTGQTGIETLPEGDTKTAFEVLREEFYVGTLSPVEIVVDGDVTNPQVIAGAEALIAALAADPTYGSASIEANQAGDLGVISVPMRVDFNSPEAFEAIKTLRGELIPAAFGDAPATVLVTGGTAFMDDFNSMLATYMPIVFAFVLALSFIVLTVAFRSIVIPFMSIFMNLLSVGAAYGMLVLASQQGYGEFLGLAHTPIIESWIPVFLFCILFGLSMDYHFFLLSRIREHFDLTGDNDESVAAGLQSTGRIITGAALIMVVVFGAFAAGRLVTLQQLGFGLAVSVFVDATIVRSILVPSLMKLIGKYNWYLPNWLGWMPRVAIEGQSSYPATPSPVPAGAGDD
jgi:putative drug exporter of the RND superfamily